MRSLSRANQSIHLTQKWGQSEITQIHISLSTSSSQGDAVYYLDSHLNKK